ncbi:MULTISPECIES: hypothetical protein [unclassified Polaribacter]|uniref:hypothetical protein n=1 Tax=unclassified Polaribacter TaxID=196858 RepID=UPI0011BD7DDA|nr:MULTISPECIES: hypothetical protein [unclassified Polaribacter]TXD50795.1 hypothetical protein ES043_14615 [Polaribacter sp. IC063]TXD57549.1 hypothetical protein ES044_14860 [Polaribacter sp. IC066]
MNKLKRKARPTETKDNVNLYKNNFFIVNYKNEESYFSLGEKSFLKLKTPVPNIDFELKGVYDFTNYVHVKFNNMKAILCHISDGTTNTGMDGSKKCFIDEEILFSEVLNPFNSEPSGFKANENDWIIVFVLNNNKSLSTQTKEIKVSAEEAISFAAILPNEGGGGVIVKHP